MTTYQLEEEFGLVRLQCDLSVQRPRGLMWIVLSAQNWSGGKLFDKLLGLLSVIGSSR